MSDWVWIIFLVLVLGGGEAILEMVAGVGVFSVALAKARGESKKKKLKAQLAIERKANDDLRALASSGVGELNGQLQRRAAEHALMGNALLRVQAADDAYPQLGHDTRAQVDRAVDVYLNSLRELEAPVEKGKKS